MSEFQNFKAELDNTGVISDAFKDRLLRMAENIVEEEFNAGYREGRIGYQSVTPDARNDTVDFYYPDSTGRGYVFRRVLNPVMKTNRDGSVLVVGEEIQRGLDRQFDIVKSYRLDRISW